MASVPAPRTSPVAVTTSYTGGGKEKTDGKLRRQRRSVRGLGEATAPRQKGLCEALLQPSPSPAVRPKPPTEGCPLTSQAWNPQAGGQAQVTYYTVSRPEPSLRPLWSSQHGIWVPSVYPQNHRALDVQWSFFETRAAKAQSVFSLAQALRFLMARAPSFLTTPWFFLPTPRFFPPTRLRLSSQQTIVQQ